MKKCLKNDITTVLSAYRRSANGRIDIISIEYTSNKEQTNPINLWYPRLRKATYRLIRLIFKLSYTINNHIKIEQTSNK